jgi:transcriptional regulator PpsR
VTAFRSPRDAIGDLDCETAASLVTAATDLVLSLDHEGVIRDLACGEEDLLRSGCERWLGRPWLETVTDESRPKVEALLRQPCEPRWPRWRQVNHPVEGGPDLPILYRVVRLGGKPRLLALGRDLRAVAALQRRLIDAQQAMERDYARLRHIETRYRLLFQTSSEAILVVDATSQKILEINPAAGRLLAPRLGEPIGRGFLEAFAVDGALTVQALLAGIRASGRPNTVRARLVDDAEEILVSASLFPQGASSLFLIHLVPSGTGVQPIALPEPKARLLAVVESIPDGFVVTGPDGRILAVNAAFLQLAELAAERRALGESLDRWLGRPGVDFPVLAANLRRHGIVRLFTTTLRGEHGTASEVEITGVAVPTGEQPCFGFALRDIGRRLGRPSRDERGLPRSAAQLAELVGKVPLKDLVRETTDVIERLCIETALEMTGDNRASAAELLGLSRQSLYVKLRRYGLGELGSDESDRRPPSS